MPTVCLVSFRLGGGDGVSVEAAKWADALAALGWRVTTVAGSGPVDVVLPGLAMDAPEPPTAGEMRDALAPADLVVVENICSLPLNPAPPRSRRRRAPGAPRSSTTTTWPGSVRISPTSRRRPTTRRGPTSPSTS